MSLEELVLLSALPRGQEATSMPAGSFTHGQSEESGNTISAGHKHPQGFSLTQFPSLAIELVRHILELAAYQNKLMAVTLVGLSKAVRTWITPIIYYNVNLRRLKQLQRFCRTMRRSQLGASVRILIIRTYSQNFALGSIADAIRACTHLKSLVTEGDMTNPTFEGSTDSFPGPWHLMVLDSGLEGLMPPLGHPLLRNVTHLYIFALDVDDSDDIALILSLPSLTHLACGCFGDDEHWHATNYVSRIERVLASPSLRMVLLHAYQYVKWPAPTDELTGFTWRMLAQIKDRRLLAQPGLSDIDYIALVGRGGTVWDDADEMYKNWRTLVENE